MNYDWHFLIDGLSVVFSILGAVGTAFWCVSGMTRTVSDHDQHITALEAKVDRLETLAVAVGKLEAQVSMLCVEIARLSALLDVLNHNTGVKR